MNAQQLKALRRKLGLTQGQLGNLLHRSRAQINRYENGTPIDGAVAELAGMLEGVTTPPS